MKGNLDMPAPDPHQCFLDERRENIARLGEADEIRTLARAWVNDTAKYKYTYHFTSLGRPIIQFPQDMVCVQELIWHIRPDLVVETGIAHGGSLIMSASMLALLDYCDAIEAGRVLDPRATRRRVIGIDIDIRPHNRAAIEAHPMSHRIDMIEGSSVDPDMIARVRAMAKSFQRALVILDSNHTHEHVLQELEAYAPLTAKGSYCIVFDTVIEDMPDDAFPDRPWGKGNNPKTAVQEFMRSLRDEGRVATDGGRLEFAIDRQIEHKLLITVAPDGYLRRV